jgi:hypothetical protein
MVTTISSNVLSELGFEDAQLMVLEAGLIAVGAVAIFS